MSCSGAIAFLNPYVVASPNPSTGLSCMTNIAIIVGNSTYTMQTHLLCCENDVAAVNELLESTGRFSVIKPIVNTDADQLKKQIRETLDASERYGEIFFYFSGHGYQVGGEFFYCGTNFDPRRPNETGLSNSDLHGLIRPSAPTLLVKVIDACNSGTPLIKSNGEVISPPKGGFNSIYQFASCLDDQESLTGDPISEFTQKFLGACVRKAEGSLFYTDIVSTLRDDYISNEARTPHFVTQATGREIFVEDLKQLIGFRSSLAVRWAPTDAGEQGGLGEASATSEIVVEDTPTVLQLLRNAEEKVASPDQVKKFIDSLFDSIKLHAQKDEFADYFETAMVEHADFREPTTRNFIVRCLQREKRPDNFVFADVVKKKRRSSAWESALAQLNTFAEDFSESWELNLNCTVERVQLKITLTPRFSTLQRLVLVVTCAPSLYDCYVFEMVTQHQRTDFTTFSAEGSELAKRWYQRAWRYDSTQVADQICEKWDEVVRVHLEQSVAKLGKG